MIWNAKAVNRSSKCNPGSQPLWFETSLPVVQRKAYLITAFWRKRVRVGPVSASHAQGRYPLTVLPTKACIGFPNCALEGSAGLPRPFGVYYGQQSWHSLVFLFAAAG